MGAVTARAATASRDQHLIPALTRPSRGSELFGIHRRGRTGTSHLWWQLSFSIFSASNRNLSVCDFSALGGASRAWAIGSYNAQVPNGINEGLPNAAVI